MIYHELLYKAAHKVDWRRVGRFLSYPKAFDENVFREDLLSWAQSLKFYDKGMSEARRRLKMLALFNYLWETNREALSDAEKPYPRDINSHSGCALYSNLVLLFYETSMWSAPQFFWGRNGHEADAIRLRPLGEQDHEMLGIMSNIKMHGDYGKFDISTSDNSEVLTHLHKHQWLRPSPLEAAPVLGLSFHAHGLKDFLGKEQSWLIGKESCATMSGWAVWYSHDTRYNDWTKRYLMFILAQRLYIYRNVSNVATSLERWLFAILYLQFYRKGPDGLLSRPSLLREWRILSDEQKETEAADCRKVFIETSLGIRSKTVVECGTNRT